MKTKKKLWATIMIVFIIAMTVFFINNKKSESNENKFINLISKKVTKKARENNMLPSIVIAQAIVESGTGTSDAAQKNNNLFGTCDDLGRLRIYDSIDEGIDDYFNVMKDEEFSSVRNALNYRDAAKAINFKYSTNPGYSKAIQQVISKYRLYKYDRV